MDEHIQIPETKDWICDCKGHWGSLILLAPKLYQDSGNNINDFVWRLYISYRLLNSVTKSFEFPIPRCADNNENFGNFSGRMYFISLDARSDNHQIRVRRRDQENLAFLTSSEEKKKIFKVMPFGPKHAPTFYTAMMQFLRDDYTILFNETRHSINLLNSLTDIIYNDHIIIDDIFFLLAIFQLVYITVFALRKFLQNFIFPLKSVNVTSSRIALNVSVMI